MKTMQISRIARLCGALSAVLWLASPQPAAAQQFGFPPVERQIRIISPANHAVFYTPVDIPVFAYAYGEGVDATAAFTNVDFYTNGVYLGTGLNLGRTNALPKSTYGNFFMAKPVARLGAVYCLVWTNAPAGAYALTAIAQGRQLLSSVTRTSAPVNITILASIPNPNPTGVVSIVATDPVAIAGTNVSWVWPGMTNAVPAWTNWPPPRWQNFTNWGPKNALFTVRRFGDASASLTVNYNIGGTASNGVDYATLTNFVTIPGGEAYALIPIVPIDNGATNFAKTVILTLTPDTNAPPDYIVGIPPRAAAVILDNRPWPRPLPFLLPDGSFHVNASGTNGAPDGAWFSTQSSSDLQNWSPVSTNQAFECSIDFVDPDAPSNPIRFYRILQLTNTPSN
jgi:hypothetical protein